MKKSINNFSNKKKNLFTEERKKNCKFVSFYTIIILGFLFNDWVYFCALFFFSGKRVFKRGLFYSKQLSPNFILVWVLKSKEKKNLLFLLRNKRFFFSSRLENKKRKKGSCSFIHS